MTRRPLAREFEADALDADAVRRITRTYVEPDCSQPGLSGAVTSPLAQHMDELLSLPEVGKRYVLLADAGMGKTSFLLNYFNRNRKRRAGRRVPIVMVSLYHPDALSELQHVQAKNEAVAFLDAFDEDVRAMESRVRRLQEIMAVCGEFRCVVIACRPQFISNDEEALRKYAFETIHLSAFSERQMNDYLRRCIPWYQWRQRRQAHALVASMGDLASRPPLLALVAELVAAGRQLTELFELYEFMAESWLERERDWIEPDTLRALSEKLAVAIYLRSSAGGVDRIDADEAARMANVDASTIDQWQFTARSLLKRDASGRFAFVHPSTLEYLFIRAFLRGDTQCLTVRWSDFMRRLFVSGTNVMRERHGEAALRALLAQNFVVTGLFPLSEPHPAPKRLETSEILNTAAAPRSTGGLNEGPAWDPTLYVLEHHVDDSLYLCDRSSDTIVFVPTDWRRVESGAVDPESARLFLVTRGEADSLIGKLNDLRRDNRSNWRLPTLEEIDLLFLVNRQRAFIPPEQYVWSGDHTMDGERLVVRMHHSVDDLDARLNRIGVRKVLAANAMTAGYFVSSMPPLGVRNHRANFDASFPALLIRVSHGAAETFSAAPIG